MLSDFGPTLLETRRALPVKSELEDLLKTPFTKLDSLRMDYSQFSDKFTAEVRSSLLQLDNTSGVEKLMKTGYEFFWLACFFFLLNLQFILKKIFFVQLENSIKIW